MQRMTIKEALTHKAGIQPEACCIYVIRDGETVFYVGQAVNTYNRFLDHLGYGIGGPSPIGEFVRENAPASGSWLFEQYTLEDCREFVLQRYATSPQQVQDFFKMCGYSYGVDDAEIALIKIHRPYFNTMHNPDPQPLSEHYKYRIRDRSAENRKADALAALYGIE